MITMESVHALFIDREGRNSIGYIRWFMFLSCIVLHQAGSVKVRCAGCAGGWGGVSQNRQFMEKSCASE